MGAEQEVWSLIQIEGVKRAEGNAVGSRLVVGWPVTFRLNVLGTEAWMA